MTMLEYYVLCHVYVYIYIFFIYIKYKQYYIYEVKKYINTNMRIKIYESYFKSKRVLVMFICNI